MSGQRSGLHAGVGSWSGAVVGRSAGGGMGAGLADRRGGSCRVQVEQELL